MKFSLNKLVIAAILTVPAVTMASVGGTGMLGGRHDFASSQSKFLYKQVYGGANTADKVGLCSFCHTPHSAASTALLWNRGAPTQGYTWQDAPKTTGGTTLSIAQTYVGPSAKCLACHDGSVAVGDVGNYMGQSRAEVGTNHTLNSYKVGDRAAEGVGDTAPKVTKKVGAGGNMAGTHPVGVPYPFGQATSNYNGIDTGLEVVLTDYVAAPTASAAGTAGVKLYNDTGTAIVAGAVDAKTGIECSSCHDVHNKQSVDDDMLRGRSYGSSKADGYLCLQCHAKAD